MPADVDQMFSVREMPWHRKGHVPDDYPQTFEEARKLAGLDWDPVAYPVTAEVTMTSEEFRKNVFRILATSEGNSGVIASDITRLWEESLMPLLAKPPTSVSQPTDPSMSDLLDAATAGDPSIAGDKWFRIGRSDTGVTLSYQRESYTVIPNSAFGTIIDSIIGAEPGKVRLETGGCLSGGRRVWMLARLDEPHQVTGRGGRKDTSYSFPYLGVTSDHTGNASCAARLTEVRIVCGNTFSAAEAEGQRTGAVFSFSHRGNWRDRLGEAREALQFARDENARYIETMSELLGITVTREQEQLWLRAFIPEPPEGLVSDRVMRNIADARASVQGFLDGVTVEGAGIRGTAYGLVQAAGEYADHVRAYRTWEGKLNRSLLRPEPLKAKAATLALVAAQS